MTAPRVLVVDDERAWRIVFSEILEEHGFSCTTAASGAQALAEAKVAPPDVILADILMDGMDGITLHNELRRCSSTESVPVLLVTGLSVPIALLKAVETGLGAPPIVLKTDGAAGALAAIRELLAGKGRLYRFGVSIDPELRQVTIAGREAVELPERRFLLFVELFRNREPLGRETLLKRLWPRSENLDVVDVNVHRLRRDLSSCPEVRIEWTPEGFLLVIEKSLEL